MIRTPVSSSNVASIGHDAKTNTLEVEFNNGTIYHYFHVSHKVFEEFLEAPSVGKYLASEIKPTYQFAKIG